MCMYRGWDFIIAANGVLFGKKMVKLNFEKWKIIQKMITNHEMINIQGVNINEM